MSLSDNKQADIIYDIWMINIIYFDNTVSQIYHAELQLDKSISPILKQCFWTYICPFLLILFLLSCDVPLSTSYGVNISQLI